MKWKGRRQSSNIEDRRGRRVGRRAVVGGGFVGIIILLIQLFGGESAQQLTPILEQFNQQGVEVEQGSARELSAQEVEMGQFAATVLADTEDIWSQLFKKYGLGRYAQPKMVLFSGRVQTACGSASAASGPFYCPADRKVYLDLAFFRELRQRFGAQGGDFAIAYVIAHEIGHHVQTLLGASQKVRQAQKGRSQAAANKLSVALELQADFYAGVWAHYNQKYLEAGDIEEAMDAARAVGDDAIQKRMQGHVVPDSFTHGSSKQRMKWFKQGFSSGDLRQGNTFAQEGI